MGYWQNVGSAIRGRSPVREVKVSQADRAIIAVGPFQAKWMQQDYENFVREGYSSNPYVFAGIRQIALAFAGIPWKAFKDESKKKEVASHPILDLLRRPNPRMGGARFWEALISYLFLDGNMYIERAGAQNQPPVELYPLRPDRVRIVPGNMLNPIAGYIYRVAGTEIPFPPEYVRHIGFFHPTNDWYGMSPLSAGSKSIDQNNMSKQWNVSLLQNGAQMTGVMTSPTSLEDSQYRRLREQIEEQHAGFINAGRPLILEGGMAWAETGANPQEMCWEAGQKLSAREIATVLNIAPELIGDPESKTFSNYGEARKALYQENVLPLADWVRDDLNAWLSALYSDVPYLDYDKDDIEALQEDRNQLYTRNNAAFTSGWITIGMAQEAAGVDVDPVYGQYYRWQLPQFAQSDPEVEPEPEPPTILIAPPGVSTAGTAGAPLGPATNAQAPQAQTKETPPTPGGNAPIGNNAPPAAPANAPAQGQKGLLLPWAYRPVVVETAGGNHNGNGHRHE